MPSPVLRCMGAVAVKPSGTRCIGAVGITPLIGEDFAPAVAALGIFGIAGTFGSRLPIARANFS